MSIWINWPVFIWIYIVEDYVYEKNRGLKLLIFSLVALITLGVGYAIISNIDLSINWSGKDSANQNNFKFKFLNADPNKPTIDGSPTNTITIFNDINASFDVLTLFKKGDIVNAIIKVKNDSNDVGTKISLNLTNSNTEYFSVEEYIDDDELNAGDIIYVRISVVMIKTPIDNVESTNIVAKLIANPADDADSSNQI